MTQARFSDAFGFSLDAVKHWEGGRRTPEASARAFLTVIAKNPAVVMNALQPASATYRTSQIAGKKLYSKTHGEESSKEKPGQSRTHASR